MWLEGLVALAVAPVSWAAAVLPEFVVWTQTALRTVTLTFAVVAAAAAAASHHCFHCYWWRSCQPVRWKEALHEEC